MKPLPPFGPRAGTFFNDAKRYSDFSRRRFLRNVAIGAALTTLASCGMREETPPPTKPATDRYQQPGEN
jgi:nitrate/nitrite transport system substrate-binding protein